MLISIVFIMGSVCFGVFTLWIACMAILTILGGEFGGFPEFPSVEFFWMVSLDCCLLTVMSFILFGRHQSHRVLAYGVVTLMALVSLGFLAVGVLTEDQFYGDETNIGLQWTLLSILLAALVWIAAWKRARTTVEE
jgi:hypothetical protein